MWIILGISSSFMFLHVCFRKVLFVLFRWLNTRLLVSFLLERWVAARVIWDLRRVNVHKRLFPGTTVHLILWKIQIYNQTDIFEWKQGILPRIIRHKTSRMEIFCVQLLQVWLEKLETKSLFFYLLLWISLSVLMKRD